jgi:hypothetical protein
VRIELGTLKQLSGFVGAAVVDSETGLVLGQVEMAGRSIEGAAAAGMEVLRAARRMAPVLGVDEDVEETIVALGAHYHLARTIARNPAIFLHLSLDRAAANLAVARITLKQVEEAVKV